MDKQIPVELLSDDLIDSFNLNDVVDIEPEERKCITFWVSADQKAKYEALQKRSRGKFHDLLKSVVRRAIDRVKLDSEAS